MKLTITTLSNGILATIEGRIDTTNSEEFESLIQPLLNQADKNIEIDCTDLSYISSSGLRLFLILQKKSMACQGTLILSHMNEEILNIFTMTGFSKIFTIKN